jgi:VCBS repeat protein
MDFPLINRNEEGRNMKRKKAILIVILMLILSLLPLINADSEDTTNILGNEYFEVIEIADFGQAAWGVTSADFNDDGHMDFAVSYATSPYNYSTISIFYNNDNLVFTREDVFMFEHSYISDLDSGDFDNDGDIDFLFSYSESVGSSKKTGVVSILFNNGENRFSDEHIIAEIGTGLEEYGEIRINPQITSADYNGDNNIDFLIGDNSGKVEFFVNDGSGVFRSAGIIYDFGFISWGVTSADFNDDGHMDFIVVSEIKDTLESYAYLKRNNGLSTCFSPDAGEIIADTNGFSGSLINLDYNNDGDLDIIAGFRNPYIYNNNHGNYEQFLIQTLPNSPEGHGDDLREGGLSPGDFNHDGKMDFIAGGVQGAIRLFINNYQQFPPVAPLIEGKNREIEADIAYDYSFISKDINEDDIYLLIEWGDDTSTDWIGPYESSEKIIVSHTWNEKKSYTIRAKVKDSHGQESEWSSLKVSHQKEKIIPFDTNWNIISIKGMCKGWSCGTILHVFNFWATQQPMTLFDVTEDTEIQINGEIYPINNVSDVRMEGFIGASFFPFKWLLYEKQEIQPPHEIMVFGVCKQVEIR